MHEPAHVHQARYREATLQAIRGSGGGPGGSLLARRLERTLRELVAEPDQAGADASALRAFLETATLRAVGPEGAAERGVAGSIEDAAAALARPEQAQEALRGIQRLRRSLVSGSLAYLSAAGDTALEIERMFDALGAAEDAVVGRWFDRADRRESDLLAEVFHDFRSPLTSVLFLAEALYSGYSGPLAETQTRQMRLIYAAALTLHTLVENVLSSRRLASGDFEAERVPFSVAAVVDEIDRVARPLSEQNGLDLEFALECRSGRTGDPDVFRRILLNLVTNAISYTEEGRVVARVADARDELSLEVEDTGPGIDQDQLEELYSRFRSEPGEWPRPHTRNGRFSGAGLGLAICHRLTRLAGGEIWVESEMGVGTCFSVRLPFPPVQGAPGPSA